MLTLDDLKTPKKSTWCPGCGNFGIHAGITRALTKTDIPQEKLVVVSGIGCHGKIMNYLNMNGFHAIHGRVLPVATGIAISNPALKILAFSGDADCFDEGWEHFTHAIRRNINLTLIVHDNKVLGLTTGQTTSTSTPGFKTKTTPFGAFPPAMNPLAQAILAGCGFVARGFSGDLQHLQELMIQAITYKGFSFIDVLQPCVSFNPINTFSWYRERVYQLEETNHDPTNQEKALEKCNEWGDKIPLGLFYKQQRPAFRENYPHLQQKSLNDFPITNIDIKPFLDELG